MKQYFIIIIIAALFQTAFAQDKDPDAVFEKISKTYTLNDDGSISYQYFKQIKLLSHAAFNRFYGETFIIYNPDFQELKINEAYTIMADGKKIIAPDNAFNEVLPRGAAHSTSFNHLREMVVTHTGLELGATIFLDYTLTTAKDYWPALMANEVIQESSPVNLMEIIVKVPADVELYHKMYNLRTAPEIMVVGSQKLYTWKFMGVDASAKESFTGDLPKTPRLMFSTEEKMAAVVDWVSRQKAFDLKINADIEKFVNETKDEAQEIKTLLALQKEVVKNMKTDHVPPVWVGYKVRTPNEVWKSNGGTDLEKAILLSAMLNAASFNAVACLCGPGEFFDKNVGDLTLLDQAVVKVNTKNHGTLYISASRMNEQTMESLLAGDVLVPLYKNADFAVIEPAATKNSIDFRGTFTISPEILLTGLMEMELSGATNPFLDIQEDKDLLKKKISDGFAAKKEEAITINNSNPAKTAAKVVAEKENACKEQLGFYTLKLPTLSTGFDSWHINYLSSQRTAAFVLPFTLDEKYAFEIEVPDGYEFVNIKEAVNLKSKAGSVKIEFAPKNNKIVVKRELKIDVQQIMPDEYTDFRAMINEWLDNNMQQVVFRKMVD